ncbi:MAG: PorT family protein [Candidatus Symbiothrix sp.]|jgi:hypothetical protein|nr:PorT family protein [Candidatus Symbiothrix sp.]
MKKNVVFLIVILFMGGLSAQAQLKYGLKVGLNLSKVSFDGDNAAAAVVNDNMQYATGFLVGPMVEFTIPGVGLGFDAALLYAQEGFKVKNNDTKMSNTLEIPVNLKYKLSIMELAGAFVAVGPYASFNLSDLEADYKAKTFGGGLNFGLGVEFLNHLQLGINYKLGLTDNYSQANADDALNNALQGKSRGWVISVAYLF